MAQLRPQLPYMNFYRFCQLLEKNHPKAPIIGSGWLLGDEPIRFRPHPGMGFPAAKSVEWTILNSPVRRRFA